MMAWYGWVAVGALIGILYANAVHWFFRGRRRRQRRPGYINRKD